MNIYISYFYKIRFMNNNIIPVSTAIWDPKWYHENKGNSYIFSSNTILGLRAEELNPSAIYDSHSDCSRTCGKNPDSCEFLMKYYDYLNTLSYDEVIDHLYEFSKISQSILHTEHNPDVCLIVHETPDNKCSERGPLQSWFSKYHKYLQEWDESYLIK